MSGVLQGVDGHVTEHIVIVVTSCNFLCFFPTPTHVCMAWLLEPDAKKVHVRESQYCW